MMRTLRARLATIAAIVFGLLLAGLSLVSYQVLARRLDADVTERLTELTDGLHGYLRFGPDAASVAFDAADNDQAVFVHEATRYYQVYDVATGRLVAASSGIAPLGLQLTLGEIQAFRARPEPFDIATEYGRLRLSNSVRTLPDGRTYLLQVGISLEPMDATLKRYRDLLWWRVPIAVLLGALAAWWLSGFALRPLSRLAASARQIDVNALDRRLPVRGVGDELDRVAVAFNETLERLEHAVVEMRQFSSALAHELRTPLAALRGEIELALRGPGAESGPSRGVRQPDRGDRSSDALDRPDPDAGAGRSGPDSIDGRAGRSGPTRGVDRGPARTARRGAFNRTLAASERTRSWWTAIPAGFSDCCSICSTTPSSTRPQAAASPSRVSRDGHRARIDVQDTGAGLSPADLPRVFERFFRADPARSSSIARRGSRAQPGAVDRRAASRTGDGSEPTRAGSTFTVTLPMAGLTAAARRDGPPSFVVKACRFWQLPF